MCLSLFLHFIKRMSTRSRLPASKSRIVRRGFVVAGTLAVAVAVVLGSTLPAEASILGSIKNAVSRVAGITKKTTIRCLSGEVASLSFSGKAGRMSLTYSRGGKSKVQPFGLTKKQYDYAISHSVRKGSPVKACTRLTSLFNGKTVTLLGNAKNLAPVGEEQTFGNVDNAGGSGGGANGS